MICNTCLTDWPADAFYASNRTKCKECTKAAVRANRAAKIEHYQEYDRMRGSMPHRVAARAEYRQSDAYAVAHRAASERWMAKHPERRQAANIVNNAVRDGRLIPWPVCAVPECSQKPEAHHPDYSHPLDVVWLCDKHHKEAHAIARAERRKAA
jgi:hypothetical protein